MEYTIRSIETWYRGHLFRSRLEATWAAFFDLCGWDWEYEPFELEGWLPDFRLMFKKQSLLIEIKPVSEFPEDVGTRVVDSVKKHGFEAATIFGIPPVIGRYGRKNYLGWSWDKYSQEWREMLFVNMGNHIGLICIFGDPGDGYFSSDADLLKKTWGHAKSKARYIHKEKKHAH